MWSVVKKSALLAAAVLVCGAGQARASALQVRVPFPFVVQGRTLPSGQYRVERDALDPSVVLISGVNGTAASTFVLTMPAPGHDPAGEQPALTFKRDERQYRLSDIWDVGGRGREIVGS